MNSRIVQWKPGEQADQVRLVRSARARMGSLVGLQRLLGASKRTLLCAQKGERRLSRTKTLTLKAYLDESL